MQQIVQILSGRSQMWTSPNANESFYTLLLQNYEPLQYIYEPLHYNY